MGVRHGIPNQLHSLTLLKFKMNTYIRYNLLINRSAGNIRVYFDFWVCRIRDDRFTPPPPTRFEVVRPPTVM